MYRRLSPSCLFKSDGRFAVVGSGEQKEKRINLNYLMIYFVVIFHLIFVPLTQGQYSLTGSPRPVEVGSTFTFTCTTSPVQPAIAWSETTNPDAGDSATYAYIYLPNNGQCVRSSGSPPSDYTFTCNTNGVFTLSFPASYSRHKGSIWKCGNSLGGSGGSTQITLVVRVPLTSVTLQNSGPLTVNQGTSVTRTCETNPTDPVSTITWRRDSQTVNQGVTSSTRTETQGIVAISVWTKSVQWEDRGDYSCQATNNGVTRTSQTMALTVQVPVSSVTLTNISTNNQEIGVSENSTLVLTCRTSPAYPSPTVTWYIKGSQTSSGVVSQTETQTNGQIIMVSTITRTVGRDNDRDAYYCRAVNINGGKQSLTARAGVYYGPDNGQLNLAKPSVVAERIPVTLTCRTLTTVNPEVDFSWSYEDNTPITSGIGSKQGTARNTWSQTLKVTPVRDNNRQVVRCRVSNTETGMTVQTSVDLDVNYGPDAGEVQVTKSSTAIENDPVTLTCRTTNGVKPDVTFTWSVDGSEVTTGTGDKQGSSGSTWSQTLTLTPTRHQRSVRCTVSNSVFSRQVNASVDLDVNYPPDVSLSPVEGTENTDLTLRCTASGNPSIYQFEDFTQYWGGHLIQRRTGRQSGDRYDLTLSRVTYQDSGVYVCTVGNNVKQPSHSNTTVNVKASPVFSKDSNNSKQVWAEVNQNATLSQYIYCRPNCTSTNWNFTSSNSTRLLQQTSSSVSSSRVHLDVYGVELEEEGYRLSYNVINFQQEDVGLYTVTVCNTVGCSISAVNLSGSGPPVTPASFTAINSTINSVTLSWVPQYAGGNFIQEFHVEYRKNDTTDWMVKIFPENKETIMSGVVDGLSQGTMYIFRIKSVSDRKTGNNQSQFSQQTTIQTKDTRPIILPCPSALGVGAGIGIGVGISALVAVAAISGFIIWRRRQECNSGDRNRQGVIDTESRQTEDRQSSRTQQSVYTHLQYASNQNTYEKISHPYQNTGFEMSPINQDVGDNLEKQEYEALGKHNYVNTPSPGRTYENTSFNVD